MRPASSTPSPAPAPTPPSDRFRVVTNWEERANELAMELSSARRMLREVEALLDNCDNAHLRDLYTLEDTENAFKQCQEQIKIRSKQAAEQAQKNAELTEENAKLKEWNAEAVEAFKKLQDYIKETGSALETANANYKKELENAKRLDEENARLTKALEDADTRRKEEKRSMAAEIRSKCDQESAEIRAKCDQESARANRAEERAEKLKAMASEWKEEAMKSMNATKELQRRVEESERDMRALTRNYESLKRDYAEMNAKAKADAATFKDRVRMNAELMSRDQIEDAQEKEARAMELYREAATKYTELFKVADAQRTRYTELEKSASQAAATMIQLQARLEDTIFRLNEMYKLVPDKAAAGRVLKKKR